MRVLFLNFEPINRPTSVRVARTGPTSNVAPVRIKPAPDQSRRNLESIGIVFDAARTTPKFRSLLRNLGVDRTLQRAALLFVEFLSRCFDGPFFAEAVRAMRWPAFCDEYRKNLFVHFGSDLKELNL
jgi:hypothetical protein